MWRCRLRQNRNRRSRRLQSRHRRQASRRHGAHHRLGAPALQDLRQAVEGLPRACRLPLPSPHRDANQSLAQRSRRGEHRHPRRHAQTHRENRQVQRPRPAHHRRRAEIRCVRQRTPAPNESQRRHAHHVRDAHSAHPPILVDGRARSQRHQHPAAQPSPHSHRNSHLRS